MKVAKLLYLADLRSIEHDGRAGSGVVWLWQNHGPFTEDLYRVEDALKSAGEISVKPTLNLFGNPGYCLFADEALSLDDGQPRNVHDARRPFVVLSADNYNNDPDWRVVLGCPTSKSTRFRTDLCVKLNAGDASVPQKCWVRISALQGIARSSLEDMTGVLSPDKLQEAQMRVLQFLGLIDDEEAYRRRTLLTLDENWSRREVILGRHRAAIRRLAHQHNVASIALVGSMARGTDRPDSDGDFLCRFAPGAVDLVRRTLTLVLQDSSLFTEACSVNQSTGPFIRFVDHHPHEAAQFMAHLLQSTTHEVARDIDVIAGYFIRALRDRVGEATFEPVRTELDRLGWPQSEQ